MMALFLANAIELLGTALECQVDAWKFSLERQEGGPEGRGGVSVPTCWRAGCVISSLFSGGSTERILVVLIVSI